MEVLFYQAFIFSTIALTRIIKKDYLLGVCGFWTLFTVFNLFYPPLIIVQLIVVWGTYSLLKEPEPLPIEPLPIVPNKQEKQPTPQITPQIRVNNISDSDYSKLQIQKEAIESINKQIAKASASTQSPIAKHSQQAFLKGYKNDPEISPILEAIKTSSFPIFVTGKAGTGKSTLVKYIRDCGRFPNTVLLAPTGIAALNVRGQTIHSFFRLPPRIFAPSILKDQRSNTLWTKVEHIIIDEVSMVRADIMDGIDFVLRRWRGSSLPFGGAKMIFVGDFHQLPPVVPKQEKEMLEKMGYQSQFAYNAKVFSNISLEKFVLETVHRQSEKKFLEVLSDIRNSPNPQPALKILNNECFREHRPNSIPMMLTGTKIAASRYNMAGLQKLTTPVRTYVGTIEGKFKVAKDKLPAFERIDLKIGARVMALKNDTAKQWVNGSLGTVTDIAEYSVSVLFDQSGKTLEVRRVSWENIKYEWDEAAQRPVSTVIGSYTQIPLNLAWAITIHKAQGLTLDDVRIDLEGGAFATGQAYVALSRARTLAGLSLARPLTAADIIVERRHKEFFTSDALEAIKFSNSSETSTKIDTRISGAREHRSYDAKTGLVPIFEIDSFDFELVQQIHSSFSQKLEISYTDMQNNMTLRDVDANFIVKAGEKEHSYLVGHCGLKNERFAFQFDRIQRLYDVDKDKYVTKDIGAYLENLSDQ